jgi:hypothetical protein
MRSRSPALNVSGVATFFALRSDLQLEVAGEMFITGVDLSGDGQTASLPLVWADFVLCAQCQL